MDNVKIFFAGLFSNTIFKNKIVATVLHNFSKQLSEFWKRTDNILNDDI